MELSNDNDTGKESSVMRTARAVPRRTGSRSQAREAIILSALWTELVSGACKVIDTAFTERTCELVVSRERRVVGEKPRRLPKRSVEILERSLLDGARKSVAIDLQLCPSTVAELLKQGFAFMGISCWPSRIPLWIVLAAHAQRAKELTRAVKQRIRENQHFERQTLVISRPDAQLEAYLTPAAFAVTRWLVEGKSYAEMAVLRQTSSRTVANQLATVFHRLRVSGRAELLCLLALRQAAAWRISTPGGRSALVSLENTMALSQLASGDAR